MACCTKPATHPRCPRFGSEKVCFFADFSIAICHKDTQEKQKDINSRSNVCTEHIPIGIDTYDACMQARTFVHLDFGHWNSQDFGVRNFGARTSYPDMRNLKKLCVYCAWLLNRERELPKKSRAQKTWELGWHVLGIVTGAVILIHDTLPNR